MAKANKINVYCIKDNLDIETEVLKNKCLCCELCGGTLYYTKRPINIPIWVSDFFNNDALISDTFKSASSQAVFIKTLNIMGKQHTFALTFGNGLYLLKKSAIVPNFGLKIVLNIVNNKNLKKLDTQNISSVPKHKSEQITKLGDLKDFAIDYEADILTGITGGINKQKEPELYNTFGTNVTGKDSLSVNVKFDADTVDHFLETAYLAYEKEDYKKKGFGWIDNINRISAQEPLFVQLNCELDKLLNKPADVTDKVWLAVPEIIKWEDIRGFYYKNKKDLKDDIDLLDLGEDLTVDKLKHIKVHALSALNDDILYEWSALECLYAEINFNGNVYMFINSNWYQINADFQRETDNKFRSILETKVPDLAWGVYSPNQKEKDFNAQLNDNIPGSLYMDAQNIVYGGGHSQIEFCDVFDHANGNIIHVKKYAGSSVLSHLFNQAYVSATLFKQSSEFKQAVVDKMKSNNNHFQFIEKDNYNIILVILSDKNPEKAQNLPFFSKITLNHVISEINNIKGYSAYVKIIAAQ